MCFFFLGNIPNLESCIMLVRSCIAFKLLIHVIRLIIILTSNPIFLVNTLDLNFSRLKFCPLMMMDRERICHAWLS